MALWVLSSALKPHQVPLNPNHPKSSKVNVRNATEREWYVKNINPLGKVPSIRDLTDGTVLYESEIINDPCQSNLYVCVMCVHASMCVAYMALGRQGSKRHHVEGFKKGAAILRLTDR